MSKEEKEVLYQNYLTSGQSIKEFASKNFISPCIIRGLVSYHKRVNNKEQSSFLRVNVKQESDDFSPAKKSISFSLDNHQIQIDDKYLKDLLRCLL